MATNEQTMAWMMDTYSMEIGYAVPEIVTGKPISLGGSLFRHEATGAGVVMVIERACERLGWKLADQRCVVQGFGNVGGIAAAELDAHGRGRDRGLRRLRRRLRRGRARRPGAAPVRRAARLARRLDRGRPADERGAARAAVRHPRARRARGPDPRRQRGPRCRRAWSPRARTARPRSRRTRSSPSAGSRSSRTCSRTPAA